MKIECFIFAVLLFLSPINCPWSFAVEVYFSPGTDCQNQVVNAIGSAKSEISAVVYSINDPRIVHSLIAASLRGVRVEILTDRKQAAAPGSKVKELNSAGVEVRVNSYAKLEHNAFAVFDQKLAMNGSYNWTENATDLNSENCAVMPEANAVAAFQRRFDDLLRRNSAETSRNFLLGHK